MITRDDLLGLIGLPTNDRLRELSRMLQWYSFNQAELLFLEQEILAAKNRASRKRKVRPKAPAAKSEIK